MVRTNRRTIAIVAGFAWSAGLAGVACVIADPPAEIPVPPLAAPQILHDEVTPPPPLLLTWPREFDIPIYVPDPSSVVEYHVFLDYDPIARPGFYANPGTIGPDPASDDGGVRNLVRSFPPPGDLNCHTLEVVVALTFVDDHTPDAVGGDSVTWIYAPSGDLTGCPIFDGGPYDAGPVDAAVDALDASGGDTGGDGADE